MKKLILKFLPFLIICTLQGCRYQSRPIKAAFSLLPPDKLYGRLFTDVQSDSVFADSKTFVDCVPKYSISAILKKYADLKYRNRESLSKFVEENFSIPEYQPDFNDTTPDISGHIAKLWTYLTRGPDKPQAGTLIPLKYPYVVPGGRFREIYYWDSYFTMLGLLADKHYALIQDMVDNFSDLIDTYGFIPNGNRTYYLSRSQPPFYSLMITLLSEIKGDSVYSTRLKYLVKEYNFWMNGTEKLQNRANAYRNVVLLKDGEILNRYWDNRDVPRCESYREDVETARQALMHIPGCRKEEVYRNLRAAAESGWDFSSRWFVDGKELYTIQTTNIIPVDLNSLLYNLELVISKAYHVSGDSVNAMVFKDKAEKRIKAVLKYCWNQDKGYFMDYNFVSGKQTEIFSLAGVYPLLFYMATPEQAGLVAKMVRDSFLMQGGVVTTLSGTGTSQQWDAPNGWAPLQWITITGLRNYDNGSLADTIKKRWLALNKSVFIRTHKMLEKYDVIEFKETGGGEYPDQDGFGWTNGVYEKLSKENADENLSDTKHHSLQMMILVF